MLRWGEGAVLGSELLKQTEELSPGGWDGTAFHRRKPNRKSRTAGKTRCENSKYQ